MYRSMMNAAFSFNLTNTGLQAFACVDRDIHAFAGGASNLSRKANAEQSYYWRVIEKNLMKLPIPP